MSNKLEQYKVFRGYANGTVSDEEFIKVLKRFVVRMRSDRHTLFMNRRGYMFDKPLLELVMTFYKGKFFDIEFFRKNRQKFIDFIELASAIEEIDTSYEGIEVCNREVESSGISYFMDEGKVHMIRRNGLVSCSAKLPIFTDTRYRAYLVQQDRFSYFHNLYIYNRVENECYLSEFNGGSVQSVCKTNQIQVFNSEHEFKRYLLFN